MHRLKDKLLCVSGVLHIVLLLLIREGSGAEHLYYTIDEEGPEGSYIGNILSDSWLSQNFTSDITRSLEFNILSSGPVLDYFDLQRNTGILKTKTIIDREIVCPAQVDCVLKVDIAVQPSAYFRVIKVYVTIEDLNDFVPEFDLDYVEKSLVESASPGVIFPILPARDLDSPQFGINTYELRGSAGQFHITVNDLGDGNIDIRLVLDRPLDREEKDEYVLEIFAYDGGDPPMIGSQKIRLKITDINDNSPQFDQQTREIRKKEDFPIGKALGEITAQDADLGRNGQLSYMLEAKSERLYGDTFRVDRNNGTLMLARPLDYERQTLYSLKLLVNDNGAIPLTSTAIVIVHVEDVNDNAPIVTVDNEPIDRTVTVFLDENQPPEAFVSVISVRDVDQGPNGYTDCELRHRRNRANNLFRMFEFMDDEYKIVTTHELDREEESEHSIQVSCSDRGSPPLTTLVHIIIKVKDLNDNPPIFTNENPVFNIDENNRKNAFIGQMKAQDRDVGGNGKISYQFCNSVDAPRELTLDERTGVIIAREQFDHEVIDALTVCIMARDHGVPSLSASAYVTISITDVNDHQPKFNQTSYDFTVYENMPMGTQVGKVTAVDFDSPPFDLFEFVLEINPYFEIDRNSGLITASQTLDREGIELHKITAYVRSYEYPQMSDSSDITIHVLDVNDNDPIIHAPLPNTILSPISSFVPQGYNITRIIATDKDSGKNGLLNYTLTELNMGIFKIDPRSGLITTDKDLTFIQDVKEFRLRVTVQDNGLICRDAATAFKVVINASIPYSLPVLKAQTPLFRAEYRLILIACVTAIILVFIILCTVCVLFVKSKKSDHVKDGYYATEKEERYVGNQNGGPYPMQDSLETCEEKMALSADREEEPPGPPSAYHSFPPPPDEYLYTGSESEGSGSSSHSSQRQSTLPLQSRFPNQHRDAALMSTIPDPPYPYGCQHKADTPRHVTFKDQKKNHNFYNGNGENGLLIQNPECLMDGTDGTFV